MKQIKEKKIAQYKKQLTERGFAIVASTTYAHYFRFLGFRTSAGKTISGCWTVIIRAYRQVVKGNDKISLLYKKKLYVKFLILILRSDNYGTSTNGE